MKISFCTTCMGRKHHLEQTLLKNIEDNLPRKEDDPKVEFVVVDYSSKDGLKEWVENNPKLKPYLEDGTLVYARYEDAERFHHAHAKNMAHRLASGDVVCNVDADNFTGEGFARFLANQFADGVHAIVHPAFSLMTGLANDDKGFFGRIAMRRDDFMALGGYSETRFKKGWGHEDTDLITRAAARGLKIKPFFTKQFIGTIPHTDAERVANTAGGINANDSKNSLIKPLKLFFNLYFTTVQTNRDGHFGEGRIIGPHGENLGEIGRAELERVRGRTLSAIWPMYKSSRVKAVETKEIGSAPAAISPRP